MIEKLVILLAKLAEKMGRRVEISDQITGELYLVRYMLFKNPLFCVYIHRFMKSDPDVHHNHPWGFFTYIVTKGYTEERTIFDDNDGEFDIVLNKRLPGSIAYRKASDMHRVILDRQYQRNEEHLAPLTVCLIGPRKKHSWGFVEPKVYNGKVSSLVWTDWRSYLNISKDDPRYKGSE